MDVSHLEKKAVEWLRDRRQRTPVLGWTLTALGSLFLMSIGLGIYILLTVPVPLTGKLTGFLSLTVFVILFLIVARSSRKQKSPSMESHSSLTQKQTEMDSPHEPSGEIPIFMRLSEETDRSEEHKTGVKGSAVSRNKHIRALSNALLVFACGICALGFMPPIAWFVAAIIFDVPMKSEKALNLGTVIFLVSGAALFALLKFSDRRDKSDEWNRESRTILIGIVGLVAAAVIGWVSYRILYHDYGYRLVMGQNELYVARHIGLFRFEEKQEIKVLDRKWQLWDGQTKQWIPVHTPFEADFSRDHKFVFAGRGDAFLVNKENPADTSAVKLIDGEWKYASGTNWASLEEFTEATEDTAP